MMSHEEDPLAVLASPVSFQRFLDVMKNDAARDLVRKINRFLHEFSEARQDPHRDSAALQRFLSKMEPDFRKNRLWRNQPHEELNTAMEGLEKYLLTKLHRRTFAQYSEDVERDHLLSIRLAALQFVRPHHLDIPDGIITHETLLLAVKELQKINYYKAPRDKLVCILNCCRVIQNLLKTAGKAAGGADVFVPILNYVVIQAAPEHLISNIEYIRRFRMKRELTSHAEYYFMQLSGAAYFTETADAGSFTDGRQEFLSSFLQHGLLSWAQYEEAVAACESPGNREPPTLTSPRCKQAAQTKSPVDAATTEDGPVDKQAGPPACAMQCGQMASTELESWNSVLAGVNSLCDLESEGAKLLVQVGSATKLAMKHKFLPFSPPDLTVGQVEVLLSEYKALALTYEVLKEGLQKADADTTARVMAESKEGHKWKSIWPSNGHLVERHPYLCMGVYDLTVSNVADLLLQYKELALKHEALELALCRRVEQYWDALAEKDLAAICSEPKSENPSVERLDSLGSEPKDLVEELNQLRAEVSPPPSSNGVGVDEAVVAAGGPVDMIQGTIGIEHSRKREDVSGKVGSMPCEDLPQQSFTGSLMDAPVQLLDSDPGDLCGVQCGIEPVESQATDRPGGQKNGSIPGLGLDSQGPLQHGVEAGVAFMGGQQGSDIDGGTSTGFHHSVFLADGLFAGLSIAAPSEVPTSATAARGQESVDALSAGAMDQKMAFGFR